MPVFFMLRFLISVIVVVCFVVVFEFYSFVIPGLDPGTLVVQIVLCVFFVFNLFTPGCESQAPG